MNTLDEIAETRRLLALEQTEEQKRFAFELYQKDIEARKKEGVTWAPLCVTDIDYGAGSKLYITLRHASRLPPPRFFESGAVAAIFRLDGHGRQTLPGVIASAKEARDGYLTLAINEDELPDWVDDNQIGLNRYYDETTYKAMDEALRKTMGAQNNRLAELREIILGARPARFQTIDYELNIPRLNESQNEAVKNIMLARDVAVIHGPPGTGKTTTLVEAVVLTLKSEKRTLICAPSNLAVDLLTDLLTQKNIRTLRMGHPARVSENVARQTLDRKIEAHPQYVELKKLRRAAQAQRTEAAKFKRIYVKGERAEQFALAREMEREARNLEKFILDSVIEDTQAFLCTPVGAASALLGPLRFQTVFMDEAGQMLEPAAWILVAKAERVVFAGDPFQLPPTVKSVQAARSGLAVSILEKTMTRNQKTGMQNVSVLLRRQYRMHEQIMRFSGRKFYEDKLEADPSVAERVLSFSENAPDILTIPVEFIDTAGCGFDEVFDEQTLSTSNPAEAELLVKHLSDLYAAAYTAQIHSYQQIGVIAPYRAQVVQLEEALKAARLPFPYLRVDTIDGFQGQECDVIYISLTRSNAESEIGFLKDVRRMNVALTRARKKLVVVGDSATLAGFDFYSEFIDYIHEINAYRSAWEWII